MCKSRQKGVSLYLALLIMAVILSIGLGVSAILLGQIKVIRGMGDSVVAFYAADTGIERALREGRGVSGVLENGARYEVRFLSPGPDCPALYYCLKSVGIFRETRRAIEIIR
jgi:Tfp pilus assembly protein PilX